MITSQTHGRDIEHANGKWRYSNTKEPVTNEFPYCYTCGKPNYIIRVDDLTHKDKLGRKNAIERWGGIPVDACIGKEIERLINSGVVTLSCCCGHGTVEPTCLIHEESVELVQRLGYESVKFEGDKWEIKLKTEVK